MENFGEWTTFVKCNTEAVSRFYLLLLFFSSIAGLQAQSTMFDLCTGGISQSMVSIQLRILYIFFLFVSFQAKFIQATIPATDFHIFHGKTNDMDLNINKIFFNILINMLFEVVLRIFVIIVLLFFSFIRDFDGKENFFFSVWRK